MVDSEEKRFEEAVQKDLGRCKMEAYFGETSLVRSAAHEALSTLSSFMKGKYVATPVFNVKGLTSSQISYTPYGVTLIIGAWNYPINLILIPLIGAISAGNCVIIKPSEVSPNTSALMAELIPKYLDSECIRVIEGGIPETTEVLKQEFDYIFYTGNPQVGKIIMKAASEYLTPVTLELGGKNPCFVDNDVDLHVATKRIMWGKFFNAGQTCIAPDYIVVRRDFQDVLVKKMKEIIKEFYGEDPSKTPDYGRIVNSRHVKRLGALLEDVDPKNIAIGGNFDESSRYFAPTIVTDVQVNQKIMKDEIFGPILPIVPFDSLEEGVEYVNSQPHPLTLYIFSRSSKTKQFISEHTQSGSVVMNDCNVQFAQSTLPFGGVGQSGMGAYHGKFSFETFSHARPILDKTVWFDLPMRYPPYDDKKLATAKMFV